MNGFDRISAPADFVAAPPADTLLAGFLDELDHGVPYIKDISYIGKMKEYRRSIPGWMMTRPVSVTVTVIMRHRSSPETRSIIRPCMELPY